MNTPATNSFIANRIEYRPPAEPVALVCLSGLSSLLLARAFARGRAPQMSAWAAKGFLGAARGFLPAVAGPNQAALLTGAGPDRHGIAADALYDPTTLREVNLLDPRAIRCETILATAARAGRKVAALTGEEALAGLLGAGLFPDTPPLPGRPPVESPLGTVISPKGARAPDAALPAVRELVGEFQEALAGSGPQAAKALLECAAALVEKDLADVLYIGVSSKPILEAGADEEAALAFVQAVDEGLAKLGRAASRILLTADYAASPHLRPDGSPRLWAMEPLLARQFGPGFRAQIPSVAPKFPGGRVAHSAFLYMPSLQPADPVIQWLLEQSEVAEAYDRRTGILKFGWPSDRAPETFVIAAPGAAFSDAPTSRPEELPQAAGGSQHDSLVPLLTSFPVSDAARAKALGDLRITDAFEILCHE